MKYLLSVLFALFFLVNSFSRVFAYDLEVQCNNEKCAVSSNGPIFPASEQWTPEKIVEKSIILKNTSGSTREIFFKLNSENTNTLDKYINLRFFELGTSSDIWVGTLEELINQNEIDVAVLDSNEEFELIIEASMDTITPNEMQGNSSVFDFGFGFRSNNSDEDNDSDNNSVSNSSNSNSSSGENSPQSLTGEILTGISTFFPEIAAFANSEEEENETVAGERTKSSSSNVMGIMDQCSDSYMWIILLIAQAMISVLYFIKRINMKLSGFINFGGLFAFILFVVLTMCFYWPIIVSLLIFISPVVYINRELLKKKLAIKKIFRN